MVHTACIGEAVEVFASGSTDAMKKTGSGNFPGEGYPDRLGNIVNVTSLLSVFIEELCKFEKSLCDY